MTLQVDAVIPRDALVPGVRTLTTLRTGGASGGPYASLNPALHVGDDPRAVRENRARIKQAFALPREPLWLEQVHGTHIADADALAAKGPPAADGAVTRKRNRVLAVMTADCLPVVLAGKNGQTLAVAHAGWRGLAGGVLDAVLRAMEVEPRDVVAWIGPGIGPRHYEVDAKVHDAFASFPGHERAFKAAEGVHWQCDLAQLAQSSLEAAGVGRVQQSGSCTYADRERFFSYRRDGVTGRMATLAWLAGS